VYLRTLAGPAARPRAVGGGAAWVLPRGAPSVAVEQLLEAMLDPARQRRLWSAGGSFALPAYLAGWDDPAVTGAAWAAQARRYRDELDLDGDAFVSATGNGGPETAASQAVGGLRFGAGMLRDVVAGRPAADVTAQAQRRAADLYRSFGLPG
jgi:ABC-type glycerol-3-phosphate transport system substrate-binding protein